MGTGRERYHQPFVPLHIIHARLGSDDLCACPSSTTSESTADKSHSYSAFFNVYIIMHVLDAQMHVKTGDLYPVDYVFTLDNGHLLPSTCWKTLYTNLHVGMWCATAENALV